MICALCVLLGLCFGSFFNVVVSRKDWWKGRSRCDSCGKVLKWYELIPVISFLIQGGKCRGCGKTIGMRHLISELLMGLAGGIAYICFKQYDIFSAYAVCITIFILGFEAVHDLNDWHTSTIPIYIACAAVIVINIVSRMYQPEYVFFLCLSYLMFGILCWCISLMTASFIGAGDIDIYFLIFLTKPAYAAILMAAALYIFIKYSLIKPVKSSERIQESKIQSVARMRLPFVPLMMMGYMLAAIV